MCVAVAVAVVVAVVVVAVVVAVAAAVAAAVVVAVALLLLSPVASAPIAACHCTDGNAVTVVVGGGIYIYI